MAIVDPHDNQTKQGCGSVLSINLLKNLKLCCRYRTDLLLRFLYRTSEATYNVAGLQPIEWQDRRMINIDLTSVISGHLDYAKNMDTILSAVGVR